MRRCLLRVGGAGGAITAGGEKQKSRRRQKPEKSLKGTFLLINKTDTLERSIMLFSFHPPVDAFQWKRRKFWSALSQNPFLLLDLFSSHNTTQHKTFAVLKLLEGFSLLPRT